MDGVINLGHGVQMSVAQDALAAALAKAQGAAKVAAKNSRNPHLRNKYADLEAVIEAGREALSANGLAFVAHPVAGDGQAGVVYVLTHSSGQWQRGELLHRLGQSKGLQPAQADGVCISYARRYALMALLQIAAGDDTDGATDVERPSAQPQRQQRPRDRSKTPVWDVFLKEVRHADLTIERVDAWCKGNGKPFPALMSDEQFAGIRRWLGSGDALKKIREWESANAPA